MEKPAPAIDRFDRYGPRELRDDASRSLYYERMIARGIPVVRDTAEEPDKPVWRGDHAFSSDAASYSLMHFIEPEVAVQHPDWNIEKVKTEARDRFAKRLAQDLSYETRETNHQESVVRWRPIETSDGTMELATEYGEGMITLRELWNHTREYASFVGNPAAYNPEEERSQLAMQDALIRGSATGFVSVLSHPDSVRYVQVWDKQPDGEVTSKQVDLFASTGRDFSHEEGERLIQHLADFHHESGRDDRAEESAYAHFYVKDAPVNELSIRTIATAFVMQQEHISVADSPLHIAKAAKGEGVSRDTSSFIMLGRFLHDEIAEKLKALKREDPTERQRKVAPVNPEKVVNRGPIRKEPKHKVRVDVYRAVSSEHPERNGDVAETNHAMRAVMAEWIISRTLVRHAADVPAGPHAVLYWFASLEHRQTVTPDVRTPSEKHESDVPVLQQKQETPIRRVLRVITEHWRRIFPVKDAEKSLNSFPSRHVTAPGTPALKEPPALLERLQVPVLKFIHIMRERITGLHGILRTRPEAVRSQTPAVPPEAPHKGVSGEEKHEDRNKAVRGIRDALIFWYAVIDKKPEVMRPQYIFVRRFPVLRHIFSVQKDGKESRTEAKESVWILLAIIRYLVLIREAAQVGTTAAAVKSRAKRKSVRTVSNLFVQRRFSRPIIFTLAS